MAAHPPKLVDPDREAELAVEAPFAVEPRERRADVVVVFRETLELTRAWPVPIGPLGRLEEPLGVPAADIVGVARLLEPFESVLANGLEQRESAVADWLEQRELDESGERVEVGVAHRFDRFEREGPCEHADAREQAPRGGFEELVAPLDRRPQRALPLGRVAPTAG